MKDENLFSSVPIWTATDDWLPERVSLKEQVFRKFLELPSEQALCCLLRPEDFVFDIAHHFTVLSQIQFYHAAPNKLGRLYSTLAQQEQPQ